MNRKRFLIFLLCILLFTLFLYIDADAEVISNNPTENAVEIPDNYAASFANLHKDETVNYKLRLEKMKSLRFSLKCTGKIRLKIFNENLKVIKSSSSAALAYAPIDLKLPTGTYFIQIINPASIDAEGTFSILTKELTSLEKVDFVSPKKVKLIEKGSVDMHVRTDISNIDIKPDYYMISDENVIGPAIENQKDKPKYPNKIYRAKNYGIASITCYDEDNKALGSVEVKVYPNKYNKKFIRGTGTENTITLALGTGNQEKMLTAYKVYIKKEGNWVLQGKVPYDEDKEEINFYIKNLKPNRKYHLRVSKVFMYNDIELEGRKSDVYTAVTAPATLSEVTSVSKRKYIIENALNKKGKRGYKLNVIFPKVVLKKVSGVSGYQLKTRYSHWDSVNDIAPKGEGKLINTTKVEINGMIKNLKLGESKVSDKIKKLKKTLPKRTYLSVRTYKTTKDGFVAFGPWSEKFYINLR